MFNKTKFKLGKLCKYNHEYENTEFGLKYISSGGCVECTKIRKKQIDNGKKKIKKQKYERALDNIVNKFDKTIFCLGGLCLCRHEYENTGMSLRLKSNYVCPECQKNWMKNNKKLFIEKKKLYCRQNRKKINKYTRNRKKININFKISENIRRTISSALKNNSKSAHSLELLGCDIEFYKQYLESKFYNNMTWNSQGNSSGHWQIHHIIPLRTFDLSDPEQQKLAFNYTNTEPLWFEDHCKKHKKL